MPLELHATYLTDVCVYNLNRHHDDRGYFEELFRASVQIGGGTELGFVQANHSRSVQNVIRGLHFQPGMAKLLSVIRGSVQVVELDVRPNSTTFGQWCSIELTDATAQVLWIPDGFANGMCILSDQADVLYHCTSEYDPTAEHGIFPLDDELAIPWRAAKPILSMRDRTAPSWSAVHAALKAADRTSSRSV